MQNESVMLKFRGYDIIKITVNKEKTVDENNSDDNNIAFLLKVSPNNDLTKANVIVGAKIDAIVDYPYNIEVIIKGNFVVCCGSEDEKIDFLLKNASAIMYPYLRAVITTVSSQFNSDKIILPVMNFVSIFEDVGKDQILLDDSQFEDFE